MSTPAVASGGGSSSSSSTKESHVPRTKTGCQNCRLRHLKCDELRPACRRCEKSGIECVRGYNIRWRHGNPSNASNQSGPAAKAEYDFGKNQHWVKTARSKLTFLDEGPELMSIYDHDHSPNETQPPAPFQWPDLNDSRTNVVAASAAQQPSPASIPSPPQNATPRSQPTPGGRSTPGRLSIVESTSLPDTSEVPAVFDAELEDVQARGPAEFLSTAKRRRLTFESSYRGSATSESPAHLSQPSPTWHTGWTPTDGMDSMATHTTTGSSDYDLSGFPGLETTVSHSLSRIYLDTPCWPLRDWEEAKLLRHYVENLARNFDLTDPLNHFRSVVPQRAASCPTLMNAILALSARHLSKVGLYDPLVSNKYHQECLKHLIPMLDDNDAVLDENLLASTIILRHLEEFEIPITGQIPADHSHLLGAQACMTAQERAAVTGGLRQAAFWVGLRQEVYVAFVNQRPVLPALEHCNVDRSFDAAEDYIWSCRMVVICADVLCFCYGEEHHNVATFNFLQGRVEQWYVSKPASFTPVYYRPAEAGEFFPQVWYVGDEYCVGLQHFHLARILLSSHNPSIPRLGPGRAAALKAMDHEIREHVRILCGIFKSNPATAPCSTYVCMAVTMAGDKFSERGEQMALLEVLEECDKIHAWPTGDAQENLKAAWGWE